MLRFHSGFKVLWVEILSSLFNTAHLLDLVAQAFSLSNLGALWTGRQRPLYIFTHITWTSSSMYSTNFHSLISQKKDSLLYRMGLRIN